MAKMKRKIEEVGVERARQRLPELLERAHRGEPTVITKHGRSYAALVAPQAAPLGPPPVPFTGLRGSGRGLWGNVAKHLGSLRREWG